MYMQHNLDNNRDHILHVPIEIYNRLSTSNFEIQPFLTNQIYNCFYNQTYNYLYITRHKTVSNNHNCIYITMTTQNHEVLWSRLHD